MCHFRSQNKALMHFLLVYCLYFLKRWAGTGFGLEDCLGQAGQSWLINFMLKEIPQTIAYLSSSSAI